MVQLERDTANEIADDVYRKLLSAMQYPEFGIGGVPVDVAAKVFGKGKPYVIEGIESGRLPIGTVARGNVKGNVYISPKLLWEYTGYIWRGEKECEIGSDGSD